MRLNNLLHLGSLTILLMIGTGCTTMVDSNFEFNLKNISPINESNAVQTVFVKSIRDERQFAVAESTIHPEQMTISIGTVFSTGDTRNISLVMTEADKALREAKSEGGNKVIIHHI